MPVCIKQLLTINKRGLRKKLKQHYEFVVTIDVWLEFFTIGVWLEFFTIGFLGLDSLIIGLLCHISPLIFLSSHTHKNSVSITTCKA